MKSITGSRRRRAYRQGARAAQAEANFKCVLEAAVARVRSAPRLAAITLDEIAADAGVTVRTILRRFGSKDGILEAAFIEVGRQVQEARPSSQPGDIEGGLAAMLTQYEAEGDLNARVVAEEFEIPILHKLLEHGRNFHRQWLREIFGERLSHLSIAERELRITALYAATEVQLWKVLRRDLRQSREQTAQVIRRLVDGVLSAPPSPRGSSASPSQPPRNMRDAPQPNKKGDLK